MRIELAVRFFLLFFFSACAAAGTPHYDLTIRIAGGELNGSVSITRDKEKKNLRWSKRIPSDPQGLFLEAASGWYPGEDELATYSVSLELPAGQVGIVPGTLVEEANTPAGYRARFELPQPSPALDLMAGPYVVSERSLRGAAGKEIRLRTYFHREIAALAPGYLDSVAGYLARYEKQIGDYPFGQFSVVSSPTPTGYGMAALTYLGIEVLKLPFIRATSLGHEVLHNWWGNGVYPDYARGNWSEGLTTFMADYAYKEREGAEAAREMRLAWLRDLAALPPGDDFALRAFVSRTHSASQIVGYRKSAMLFLMLRDALGAETFDAGLRAFWQEQRFRIAGWDELRRAFERVSGRSLETFFAQWLERPGLPEIRIARASAAPSGAGWRVEVTLAQDAAYESRIPVLLRSERGEEAQFVSLTGREATFTFETAARPRELVLDPEARVLRRLAPAEAPPILRSVALERKLRTVLLDPAPSARRLAEALVEHPIDVVAAVDAPPAAPLLVVGRHAQVDAWLARHALAPRPASLAGKGSAQVWTVAREGAGPLAIVSARDAPALDALLRPLPHYGGQSFIAFDGAKALERGVWPSQPQAWKF